MYTHAKLLFLISSLVPSTLLAQASQGTVSESLRPPEQAQKQAENTDLAKAAEMIVQATNRFRKEQDLEMVKQNSHLNAAARYFADYMAENDKYGHTADEQQPAERAESHGYEYCIVLENIAYAYSSRGFPIKVLAKKFETGWENSPEHRKNMLDPDVLQTGVAIAQSKKTNYYYAVQMFGRPKSASIKFQIDNQTGLDVTYKIAETEFTLPAEYIRSHVRCRPEKLIFTWSEETEQKPKTVQPHNGDKLILTKKDESDEFEVRFEGK